MMDRASAPLHVLEYDGARLRHPHIWGIWCMHGSVPALNDNFFSPHSLSCPGLLAAEAPVFGFSFVTTSLLLMARTMQIFSFQWSQVQAAEYEWSRHLSWKCPLLRK